MLQAGEEKKRNKKQIGNKMLDLNKHTHAMIEMVSMSKKTLLM